MIKLKDILLEAKTPSIFIPRRIEGRVERMIKNYIRNGSKGNLNLQDLNLTVLPEILKDIKVDGSFYCGNNYLTSLENAPKYVSETFGCSSNYLTSLEGAPKTISGDFYCSHNNLTSLKGTPESIGGDFKCNDNKLTSLDGVPKFVGGSFVCKNNIVKFTEKQVRAVCDVKGDVYL